MDYEKYIDIPFGAKDSELKGFEYTIPDGMEAIIKDGKVIVREKESGDERIRERQKDKVVKFDHDREQKPAEDWREKRKKECPFRRNLDNNLYGCEQYAGVVYACDGNCSWVVDYPKLKEIQDKQERKPAEWSEEDEKMLDECVMALSNWRDAVSNYGHEVAPCQRLIDRLKSLRPRPHWKPSDEQMKALNEVANNGVLLDLFNDLLKLL